MKVQCCVLPPLEARMAASITRVISAAGTASGLKWRSERALYIASNRPMSKGVEGTVVTGVSFTSDPFIVYRLATRHHYPIAAIGGSTDTGPGCARARGAGRCGICGLRTPRGTVPQGTHE